MYIYQVACNSDLGTAVCGVEKWLATGFTTLLLLLLLFLQHYPLWRTLMRVNKTQPYKFMKLRDKNVCMCVCVREWYLRGSRVVVITA